MFECPSDGYSLVGILAEQLAAQVYCVSAQVFEVSLDVDFALLVKVNEHFA